MFCASKCLLVLLLVSVAVANLTIVLAENQWTRYGSSPILSPPSWAPGGALRPRVVYDRKTFGMWFSGVDLRGRFVGIGYATSTDGLKWVENAQPVLTATSNWEGNSINIGSVIWTGSQFMMWYRGVGGPQGSAQANGAVGFATSPDGVAWTKYSGNPVMTTSTVDSDFLTNPYVIQVGSSFKMWYACKNPTLSGYSICYAASSDGIGWTKQSSPVLQPSSGWEAGGLYSPTVVYDGTIYGMWYTGGYNPSGVGASVTRIGYATSSDGFSWSRDPNNPILSPGPPGGWDAGGVENQCAVQDKGGFLLYYDGYGTSASSVNYIGLAQSPAHFTLPEITSPLVTIGIVMGVLVTRLLCGKRRQTGIQNP